jgi:hypothetical protein
MRDCHRLLRASAWVLPLLLIMAIAPSAMAQTTLNVTYNWTAPTTGSPVHHYVVQKSEAGGAWTQVGTSTTTAYTLAATVNVAVQIRVAGVDSQSRQGVWSTASDSFTPDAGVPGQPGKPVVVP